MTAMKAVVQQAGRVATCLGPFILARTTMTLVSSPSWPFTMHTVWLSNVAHGHPIDMMALMKLP